jgi:hypothetical protein
LQLGAHGSVSKFYLLRKPKSIVHLNAKIADSRFDLRMTEQKLNGAQIFGLAIDLRNLRATQRMSSERTVVQGYALDPTVHDPRILLRRYMWLRP